jgi:hypothetical protein
LILNPIIAGSFIAQTHESFDKLISQFFPQFSTKSAKSIINIDDNNAARGQNVTRPIIGRTSLEIAAMEEYHDGKGTLDG